MSFKEHVEIEVFQFPFCTNVRATINRYGVQMVSDRMTNVEMMKVKEKATIMLAKLLIKEATEYLESVGEKP